MQEFITAFALYLEKEKKAALNTRIAYIRDIRQFDDFLAKQQHTLSKVTQAIVDEYVNYLQTQLRSNSVLRKLMALKLFFAFTRRTYCLPLVTITFRFPQPEQPRWYKLKKHEIDILLKRACADRSPTGIRTALILYLFYKIGMKQRDICALNLNAFNSNTLNLQLKNNKLVPLQDSVGELFKQHVQFYNFQSTKSVYAFVIQQGKTFKPMTRQAFWSLIKQSLFKANIKQSALHHVNLLKSREAISNTSSQEIERIRRLYDVNHPRS